MTVKDRIAATDATAIAFPIKSTRSTSTATQENAYSKQKHALQVARLSDSYWLTEEVLPTVGTSRSNSRSQSRSRKISSLKTNCSSSKASLDSSSTTMRSRDIPTDSIAFAEDHKAAKEKRERTKSRSRMIGESPSPRSRNLSTYDMYRLSPEERPCTDCVSSQCQDPKEAVALDPASNPVQIWRHIHVDLHLKPSLFVVRTPATVAKLLKLMFILCGKGSQVALLTRSQNLYCLTFRRHWYGVAKSQLFRRPMSTLVFIDDLEPLAPLRDFSET
ncbi:hypothetical protein DOTSEDRAFT_80559 [Dothistroma septosporum NZE10]|uniref:Uncharacterized protein n=1 Tax=Dothistroma septosporum (strain NZE10 / CBS 128990) TaxID=675120 RepID=M2YLY1_DOTSN|nr:hypothetical protein DOTSEDRAFT_80559 [Dothistroma septosporum NZE10]